MNSPGLMSSLDTFNRFSAPGRPEPVSPREVPIRIESDIVHARLAVREAAKALGFGPTDTTRIVTAASELARNILKYAGSGLVRVRALDTAEHTGIEIEFEDQGPGIADLDQAMTEGFSTSGGFGMGLPGAKRLMDELNIQSELGVGTRISLKKWRQP